MKITLRNHVKASLRDGIWTNLATGMGENYFVPFLIILGFSDVVSGFGATIPMFIGTCFQLLSNLPITQTQSLKKRIIIFLGFQAFFLLLLIGTGLMNTSSTILVFGVLSLYWSFALTLLPPWNRLMGHTVPRRLRLKFFSTRLQLSQTSIVLGLVTSGAALYFSKKINAEKECFLILFSLCFILKILSMREFTLHQDYKIEKGDEVNLSPWSFIKRLQTGEQGKLILFLFFFYFAIHFSAPFFNPYMLKTLEFNYLQFMMIIMISMVGRIFMSRMLKKYAKPKSMGTILFLACLGISSTPILWSINQSYPWLFGIEFISGCYWSMFDLSCLLLFFDKINDQERTSIMSYISFSNTLGMCLGSLCGGYFLSQWNFPADRYLSLFMTSSLVRFLVILFIPTFQLKGFIKNFFDTKNRYQK